MLYSYLHPDGFVYVLPTVIKVLFAQYLRSFTFALHKSIVSVHLDCNNYCGCLNCVGEFYHPHCNYSHTAHVFLLL